MTKKTLKDLENEILKIITTQNEEMNNFYKNTKQTLAELTTAQLKTNKILEDHQKRFELIYQYNQNHEKLRHQRPIRYNTEKQQNNLDYYDEYETRRHYNERNR